MLADRAIEALDKSRNADTTPFFPAVGFAKPHVRLSRANSRNRPAKAGGNRVQAKLNTVQLTGSRLTPADRKGCLSHSCL